MPTVISVENLSKSYRLGQINTPFQAKAFTGPAAVTFTYDLQLWWAKLLGKPNPLLGIGASDYRDATE